MRTDTLTRFVPLRLDEPGSPPNVDGNPLVEVLLLQALHAIVLYLTRQHAYRVVILAVMVYVAAQIYRTLETANPITVTCVVGCVDAYDLVADQRYVLGVECTHFS